MAELLRAICIGFLLVSLAVGTCLSSASVSPAACRLIVSGRTGAEADRFLMAQQEGVASNPRALTFTIRLKDNKAQFQQGEIIGVELPIPPETELEEVNRLGAVLVLDLRRWRIEFPLQSSEVSIPGYEIEPLRQGMCHAGFDLIGEERYRIITSLGAHPGGRYQVQTPFLDIYSNSGSHIGPRAPLGGSFVVDVEHPRQMPIRAALEGRQCVAQLTHVGTKGAKLTLQPQRTFGEGIAYRAADAELALETLRDRT